MCGITFTFAPGDTSGLTESLDIWGRSVTRGSDSSGIAVSIINKVQRERKIYVFKANDAPQRIVSDKKFKNFVKTAFEEHEFELSLAHTRMNTDGYSYKLTNNQPLLKKDVSNTGSNSDLVVLNGIIVNASDHLRSKELNDGFALFNEDNDISALEGTLNFVKFIQKDSLIQIYSNNNNLFSMGDETRFFVASEPQFLGDKSAVLKEKEIKLENMPTSIEVIEISSKKRPVIVAEVDYNYDNDEFQRFFEEEVVRKFTNLRRCNSCILPETHPFITFDKDGVCNFCRDHQATKLMPKAQLENILSKSSVSLLGLSGGRDSCYALHKLASEYNIKPITYTYDWGVNTNLARRNISRMCSKLEVENILIAADIRKKRENVKLNLLAWFNKPHLGIIPLLMAGDKQFISNAATIKKTRNVDLEIFAFNLHEKTQFKEELTGIKMWGADGTSKFGEDLALIKQLRLMSFYGFSALKNPSLLNRSIMDSLRGFVNYYHSNVDILQFFNYENWNEQELNKTLEGEYAWEFSHDTPTSWRIGDGTAAFYNLAYYIQLGFTENDVIRSNLIRNGQITRSNALKLVCAENKPRLPTLKWYCDVLELDIRDILKLLRATFYSGIKYA